MALQAECQELRVLFDHDGAIDDLISLMLVLAVPEIELVGVVVTPADCYLEPSLSANRKILRFFGRDDIVTSAGDLHGVNAFPREWRRASYALDALPILNESDEPLPPVSDSSGRQFIAEVLRDSPEPVTVLVTGPVSNVVSAIRDQPGLQDKIKEVVWMGGALHVPGNVQDYEHDGSAEWNAYWDPPSTAHFFEMGLPITLFPLDITNQVPVSMPFLHRLAKQRRYALSDLAGQAWAMTVGTIPSYVYTYHMWDTLCAGVLSLRDVVTTRKARCKCTPSGPASARIQEDPHGSEVSVANSVDVSRFYDHVLALLRRCPHSDVDATAIG
jgi:purine nucleosidase